MIPISEMFYSVQGEGPLTGLPVVFVRVGGCNFKCPAFSKHGCDSHFSVDGSFKSAWNQYSIDDLFREINLMVNEKGAEAVVFTGGEPTIHEEFLLLASILSNFVKVQIETNGSKMDDVNLGAFEVSNTTFVISPKLANSGNNFDYDPVMKQFHPNNYYFKFVMGAVADGHEILDFVEKYKIRKDRVYIMPKGENQAELNETQRLAWTFALKHGLRYSDRLHIRVWDNKRGV